MLKKLAAVCVAGAIIASFVIAWPPVGDVPGEDVPSEPADITMSTKSSRPGCGTECYVPATLTIQAGQTVTWENLDAAFHSVTSGAYGMGGEMFDSGHLDPYQKFQVTFPEAGMYGYHCTLHPWMVGIINVR